MQLEDGSRLLGSEVRHRRFVWSKDDHTRRAIFASDRYRFTLKNFGIT